MGSIARSEREDNGSRKEEHNMSITTEAAIIKIAMMRRRIGTITELAERTGMEAGTLRKHMREPSRMQLFRLREIVEAAGLTDEEIAKLVRAR